ncbi:hypothetical protein Nepgr_029692 [Nepenthes gracilis]|uniref:Uncharacterized protein n=1 Tax=Nepenthes gracilis TaxID=150966 RepID=A0AAD3TES7_NEPGR|nr:hypothetical protein Nepgr_029692 [Nepenthes gracilis]
MAGLSGAPPGSSKPSLVPLLFDSSSLLVGFVNSDHPVTSPSLADSMIVCADYPVILPQSPSLSSDGFSLVRPDEGSGQSGLPLPKGGPGSPNPQTSRFFQQLVFPQMLWKLHSKT